MGRRRQQAGNAAIRRILKSLQEDCSREAIKRVARREAVSYTFIQGVVRGSYKTVNKKPIR